jgi:hypothetical protein
MRRKNEEIVCTVHLLVVLALPPADLPAQIPYTQTDVSIFK